jgi:uncharacterized membrane protein YhaH (DUF805 family)
MDVELIKRALTTDYFNFKGRAGRKEFWLTMTAIVVFNFLFTLIVFFINPPADPNNVQLSPISYLPIILTFIPQLSLAVRRVHDFNCTGLLVVTQYIPLIGFLLGVTYGLIPGTEGPNSYGQPPALSALDETRFVSRHL